MSNTFRFLETAASQNAAQSFLDSKLAQNKKSIDFETPIKDSERDAYNAALPDDPYAHGEGYVPSGPAYPSSGGSSSSSSSGGVKGSMNAEQVRAKFGLTYEGEKAYDGGTHEGRLQNEDGDIWYKDGSGAIKYLGNMGSFERGSTGQGSDKSSESKTDKSRFHKGDNTSSDALLQQAHLARNQEVNDDNDFNSINDVGHAMRYLMDGSGSSSKPSDAGRTPIKHSPQIRQAKERLREYETKAWNGTTSAEIFGGQAAGGGTDYNFDHNKGGAGIGTSKDDSSFAQADHAAGSFLNHKKQDLLKEMKFVSVS